MSIDRQTIAKMKADPAEFRRRLLIDTGSGVAKPFGELQRPFQVADFAAVDPAWQRLVGIGATGGFQRAYFERPRGHSKTTDLALMCLYPLLFAPTQIRGIWAAGDRDQAAIGLQRISQIVSLNPWLAEILDVQRNAVVNRRTGSTLSIISSDAASSWGHLVEFIVCDELSTWERSGEELWASLLSTAAKKANCVLVVISNAGWGAGSSWQWHAKEKARTRDGWYFHSLPGPDDVLMPADRIEELRDFLPEKVIQRVAYNVWSTDVGDLLRSVDIDAACTLAGPAHKRGPGHHLVVAGVDIGLVRDSSAVTVVAGNFETQRIALLDTTSWNPRKHNGEVPIRLVEDHLQAMQEKFVLDVVVFDSWQFEGSAQALVNRGFNMCRWNPSPASQNTMANTLLRLFYERRVDLYPDHLLLQDLRSLTIVERANKLRIEAPRNEAGHCDRALSMATACPLALDTTHLPYPQIESYGLAIP